MAPNSRLPTGGATSIARLTFRRKVARPIMFEHLPEDSAVPLRGAPRGPRERVSTLTRSPPGRPRFDEAITLSSAPYELVWKPWNRMHGARSGSPLLGPQASQRTPSRAVCRASCGPSATTRPTASATWICALTHAKGYPTSTRPPPRPARTHDRSHTYTCNGRETSRE